MQFTRRPKASPPELPPAPRGLPSGVRTFPAACLLVFAAFLSCLSVSCSNGRDDPIIIWSERSELASCVELFNASHDIKAVLVYKDGVSRSLPPARDEGVPDLVVGSWLKTSAIKRHFSPTEKFFSQNKLSRADFYAKLLSYGLVGGSQYLLPVSFNLPAIVFDEGNSSFVAASHVLTLDQIRAADAAFSVKDERGTYGLMGFAPSWDADFLYLVAKAMGASFSEGGLTFSYDRDALEAGVRYVRDWTLVNHGSSAAEQDFKFSYLYRSKDEWLSAGRSLFSYMTSREFYTMRQSSESPLAFRWVAGVSGIMVEDDIVCMGLYRKARNPNKAEVFIEWFFREDTQKALLERYRDMALDTPEFGIAGGFSSLKDVNATLFPVFYHDLLGNMPLEEQLVLPAALPARYDIFKKRIVIPFLVENCQAEPLREGEQERPHRSLDDYIADWRRQAF